MVPMFIVQGMAYFDISSTKKVTLTLFPNQSIWFFILKK